MDVEDSYEFEPETIERIARSVIWTEQFTKDPRTKFAKFAFTLLTDPDGEKAVAKIMTLDEAFIIEEYAVLNYKWGVLDGARAGYEGDCTPFDGSYYFNQGPCVTKCFSSGDITPGTAPTGHVDEAYEHEVTSTGLDSGTLELSGLPDGLTSTGGVITGTPTTAGTYFVIASGTAPKTGPSPVSSGETCTITIGFLIVIEESLEPEPDPETPPE